MALGEGSRKIGEPCWSHIQCRRWEEHSYCDHLVCTCKREFHNIDGKCSKNYWEDLGLQNWQLLVIAFITTLFFLAVFVGCISYVFLKIVRKYRRTRPSGDLAPLESFKTEGASNKRFSLAGEGVSNVKVSEVKHTIRRQSLKVERTRALLRREMDVLKEKEEEKEEKRASTIKRQSLRVERTRALLRRELDVLKEKEEGEEEDRASGASMAVDAKNNVVPATSIRSLTKFILPLHYNHSHGSREGGGDQRCNLRRSSSLGSWSLSSWEMDPLEEGLDWWPVRKQFRLPVHR